MRRFTDTVVLVPAILFLAGMLSARSLVAAEPKDALDRITRNEGFQTTEGLDLVWKLQADPANVVMSSVTAELASMKYSDSEYRWPAVFGNRGSISVRVPKAGTYWPAVVVYDMAGFEAYELQLDGRRLGRFVAAEDDNRQRIHFLDRPIAFRGGERLTWLTGTVGNHVTEDILLLAQKPPVRGRRFELSQAEAGYAEREGKAQARLTWITTWPAACTIEYGPTAQYGRKLVESEPVANHREYLPDVALGQTVHWRIVAPRPDGKLVASADATFTLAPPAVPAGSAKRQAVPLAVQNPYDFPLREFPLSSGVPFAQGELTDAGGVRLLDPHGAEVPVQAEPTVRWKDGSIKWLLVTFLAAADAKSTASYTLQYGAEVRCQQGPSLLRQSLRQGVVEVHTGPLRVDFDARKSGFPTRIWFDADRDGQFSPAEELTSAGPIVAEIAGPDGTRYAILGPVEGLRIEQSGPIRTVIKTTGRHRGPGGKSLFSYTNRFEFCAGSPLVRVYYAFCVDGEGPHLAELRSCVIRVPVPASLAKRTLGLADGQQASGQADLSASQIRDDQYSLQSPQRAGIATTKGRLDGWMDLSGSAWGVLAAVRDFWQLYPKGLRADQRELAIELLPAFAEGTYYGCSKLEEVKLYYYLMGGKYRIARGVRKQHEMLLAFHAGGLTAETQHLVRALTEPLIAVCPPERYADTGVFGEILPATTGRTAEYEKVCEKAYQNAVRERESARAYGMLNFGDQWGERGVNWYNGEYDRHHAMLLQFARCGERKWYFLGEKAARHAIDVDTAHAGPQSGGEWLHSMGHTGGYFRQPHEGRGFPGSAMSICHTWTEGFCEWYALSGDPTALENAQLVADHYGGRYLNNYDWEICRTNGWHLLLTIATYRLTRDPYYLNAARIIIERTLERQSPGGGWHRQMVPGHCLDMPRHRGEAGFMLGVLADGLEEYYREVPDPRVAEAVQGGARQAVRELWVPKSHGFRYTSCPNMRGDTGHTAPVVGILFFAFRLGGERQFGRIAQEAVQMAFRVGIGSSIVGLRRMSPIVYNMDLLSRQGVTAPEPQARPFPPRSKEPE
jgi:hypothetical protein